MGFMVVKDVPSRTTVRRKEGMPGVIGCDVLQQIHRTPSEDDGPYYINKLKSAPDNQKMVRALTLHQGRSTVRNESITSKQTY